MIRRLAPALRLLIPLMPVAASLGGIAAASAQESRGNETERLGLDGFLKAAEESGAQLAEARARLGFAKARAEMAVAKAFPTGTLDTLVAPLPGTRGDDALTARTDWGHWGAFWTTRIEIAQPLYTFGALAAGRDAAAAGVEAEQKLLERDRLQLRTEIHEFYFGYQLAFELTQIARDVIEKLESAHAKAKTSADRQRLEDFLLEARVRLAEGEKILSQIRAGMAWKIGVYGQKTPRWDRASLSRREVKVGTLAELQAIARESRPELKALQAELRAKEALARVESGLAKPSLYLGGRLTYSVATARPNFASPYIYDPYNELVGGVGLGLRWNLNFLESGAKASMARAEALQAEGKTWHLGQGILVEVEKRYHDFEEARRALELREKAGESYRRRYRDALAAYGLGSGNAKQLLEEMGAYALSEKARLESVFNFNMTLARLEQSIGRSL